MGRTTAILGKGSTGKTFIAANLAMALGSIGERTLLVGCDQKRDAVRALSREGRPSLIEVLESTDYDYEGLGLESLVTRIDDYVDVLELGASQLLVGHYGAVLDEAFHVFDELGVWDAYDQVLFDVTDERFDAAYSPLFRRAERAFAVTTEAVEALWVTNRLMRAVLIGGYEFRTQLRLVGVINNRSYDPRSFERFVQRTRLFPLLTIPELPELGHLRHFSRTVLTLDPLPEALKPVLDGFIMLADFCRGHPMSVYPLDPMPDEEVWRLDPPVVLPG